MTATASRDAPVPEEPVTTAAPPAPRQQRARARLGRLLSVAREGAGSASADLNPRVRDVVQAIRRILLQAAP